MNSVGKITEINRYPVKSFAGESLSACQVEKYGLHGDRYCAFYDETKEGWASFITARDIPELLSYQAKLAEGYIQVTSPSGRSFGWDEELRNEIQDFTKRKISMTEIKAPHPEDPELMSVDLGSILIATERSMHKLETMMGKQIEMRRFRPNIVISLEEQAADEREWMGKTLVIGETELQIHSFCKRCAMVTIDPDTLERDPSLLRVINEEMDLTFGVYASVKKTGRIAVEDKIFLRDK